MQGSVLNAKKKASVKIGESVLKFCYTPSFILCTEQWYKSVIPSITRLCLRCVCLSVWWLVCVCNNSKTYDEIFLKCFIYVISGQRKK